MTAHQPAYLGALDQGTTSTRFIVFRRNGEIVASAQKEHEQIYPQPGWVEHNPIEIRERTHEVIDEAMMRSGLRAGDLVSVGITNQRETTVVWNRYTGMPVCNALVWQDMRVADAVEKLSCDGGKDRFRAKTGLPLTPYFSGLKLAWILDHVKGARSLAERGDLLFGTIDSFLLWNLTGGPAGGVHATDVTNASRTQLMHLSTLNWDDEILSILQIPRQMLPQIRSSSEHFGDIQGTSLDGVPISGILGDQQAAMAGQTCFQPGEVKNTYGTGCFLLMNTGQPRPSQHGLLTTVAYKFGQADPVYALEGSIAIAGALVQWLRDNLSLILRSEDVESLARSVEDNGGVYFVPAFSGLYAPHWNERARGLIAGLTRYVNKGHLARAVLEATAFQTCEVVRAMEQDSGLTLSDLRTDGGMVTNDLLMQFQADLLDRAVLRPVMRETTALGAAYAAGLAAGFYNDLEDLRSNWRVDKTWLPAMANNHRAQLLARWEKAVARSLDWVD